MKIDYRKKILAQTEEDFDANDDGSNMYGVPQSSLDNSMPSYARNDLDRQLMYAMGILSDAQAEIEMGHGNTARQFINKAKYYMSNVMDTISEQIQQSKGDG